MTPHPAAYATHPGPLGRLGQAFRFSWRSGPSVRERFRLLYHVGLKRSLVYRGWAKYAPERSVRLRVRSAADRVLPVCLRDNGLDVETFAEFFASHYAPIPRELPPFEPKVIYDIGANIGIASIFYASRYPHARLFGFEPVPANFAVCEMNFQGLPGSKCFPWAIGSATGTAQFEFNAEDLRGGHLQTGRPGENGLRRIQVPVYSVADLVAKQGCPPPEFVKIDVEGAEVAVLEGIGDQIGPLRRMLVETHSEALKTSCLDWLRANGFVLRHLVEAAPGYAAIWCDRP